jgi:hypothetical protein
MLLGIGIQLFMSKNSNATTCFRLEPLVIESISVAPIFAREAGPARCGRA